jgi:hypothetical protein
VLHREEDREYWQTMPAGEGKDHWFWRKMNGPAEEGFTFVLNPLSPASGKATLTVVLHGKTDDAKDPDHHTEVWFNDQRVDDYRWDGQVECVRKISLSPSLLRKGENHLVIKSLADTGAQVDTVCLHRCEMGYWRAFEVEGDEIEFSMQGEEKQVFQLAGFSQEEVRVCDVTDPLKPSIIVPRVDSREGSYQVTFQGHGGIKGHFVAAAHKQLKSPIIRKREMRNLKQARRGIDYIIIAHNRFLSGIAPLANHRRQGGLEVLVVDVEDIYDAFTHGVEDPLAIKEFLAFAYETWDPRPQYVLLVGDASVDFKNTNGTPMRNYIPTHLFETGRLGQTPSDNWFVSLNDGDCLPEMHIGRIAVQTEEELQGVIRKIIRYESTPSQDPWTRKVLFVADNRRNWERVNEGLAGVVEPLGFETSTVFLSYYDSTEAATTDLIGKLNVGASIVNYVGHGALDNWAGEFLFDSDHVKLLNNARRLPFVAAYTCLNGYFVYFGRPSLAEALLNAEDKGAVALWAPTGLGYTRDHDRLGHKLFEAIFEKGMTTIGPATTYAKKAFYEEKGSGCDLVKTFLIFGDPALRLKIGQKRDSD